MGFYDLGAKRRWQRACAKQGKREMVKGFLKPSAGAGTTQKISQDHPDDRISELRAESLQTERLLSQLHDEHACSQAALQCRDADILQLGTALAREGQKAFTAHEMLKREVQDPQAQNNSK